ncbi:MAG: sn-glycerol-1-phosphate dehydrogenase, partial [Bacteroides sp.]
MESYGLTIIPYPSILQDLYAAVKDNYKTIYNTHIMSRVEKALEAANETRALRIGSGVLSQVADLFIEQFPNKKAVIIADTNTFRVSGEKVSKLLHSAGIEQLEPFIFTDP